MGTLTAAATQAWYLIQCKAGQDARAQEHLLRQGYTCFRCTCQRERLLRGRRCRVSESLFPGYLFIHMGPHDNWGPLRSTRGVSRVVAFGGQPLSISDALVQSLMEQGHKAIVAALLEPGEQVRISHGPFAEHEAVFLAMQGEERVVVLLDFLQRKQRVSVPLNHVVGLNTRAPAIKPSRTRQQP